jgi:hypothetical protein
LIGHELEDGPVQIAPPIKMEFVASTEDGSEEWEPLHMVPMEVGKENMRLDVFARVIAFEKILAEVPYSGSCVEYDESVVEADFNARGITAEP